MSTNLEINTSGYIYRHINQVQFNEIFNEKSELLLKVIKNDCYEFQTNDCKFNQNKNIESHNNCWFLFKKSKMEQNCEKYKINEGDIIKLGRITIRIKEIKMNKNVSLNKSIDFSKNNIITNSPFDDKDKGNMGEIVTKKTETNLLTLSTEINKNNYLKSNNKKLIPKININKSTTINVCKTQKFTKSKVPKICRICYCEEDPVADFDNPLVQPCLCSGSLRYIHLNCLKQWLNTKSCTKIDSNNNYSIFLVRQIECEICKTKFPDFIKHKNNLYEILDFKSEFENYFTVESLTIDKNNTRFIYVVNLDNNVRLKIGRGHDAHLILSDISVSRVHSLLTIENKNIYIEDNNSKFGTLILVQCPTLRLIEDLPLYIQIGRTFLNCRIQKSYNIFSCCGVHEKPNYNFYFQQNEKQKQINLLNTFTIKSEIDFSEDNDELDEKEKEINEIKSNENENNRYDEQTLDLEINNKTNLKLSKGENDMGIKIMATKKSMSNSEDEKNDEKEKNGAKNKNKNKIIDKSESIILESENECKPSEHKIFDTSSI